MTLEGTNVDHNPFIPDPGRNLSADDRKYLREVERSRPWLDGAKEIGSWAAWMLIGFAVGIFLFGPFFGTLFSFVFSAAARWTWHHVKSGFSR
jgi:hypothetical protein